jgi:CubicO group peptidase (beta-lactamase class C family)
MYDGSPDDGFTTTMSFGRDSLHILHSVSKSFMSTLAGIAIQEGYISSDDASVLSFFSEHAGAYGPEKNGILLKHLMTMSSDLQWNEWDVATMDFENNDAIRY